MQNKKILVGISGGVDSTVCVKLLQEQQYTVEGAVIYFSPAHEQAVQDAKKAAAQLSIPLHIINGEALFSKNVIQPFCKSYCAGRTPNPCVICNPLVKFRLLIEKADELGISMISTGHYARILKQNGTFYVRQAYSAARDQSYMLYRLPQEILSRLLLPIGNLEKSGVRQIAADAALFNANAPDSQDICFIPSGNYPAYIEALGYQGLTGNFISPEGTVLGQHKGVLHYTVGQRRGLHIALGKPVFIKRILPNGDISLGYSGEEFYNTVFLQDVVKTDGGTFSTGEQYTVKIRSAAAPASCQIRIGENEETTLIFEAPIRAPAPGQSAVLYNGEFVAGGGFISSVPSEHIF